MNLKILNRTEHLFHHVNNSTNRLFHNYFLFKDLKIEFRKLDLISLLIALNKLFFNLFSHLNKPIQVRVVIF
jgi:hypothetical protein